MMSTGRYLGIEIGGTKLQIGTGSNSGRLDRLIRRPINPAAGAVAIRDAIQHAALELDFESGSIDAVGVGFGGPVDAASGRIVTSHHVAGWGDFPLADWLRDTFQIPRVAVANDADVGALGEATHGAGKGFSPVLYVTVGSGIGAGLVVNGEIYRGTGPAVLEIGQLRVGSVLPPSTIEPEAIPTIEERASGWSIGRRGRAAALDQLRIGRKGPLLALVEDEIDRIDAQLVGAAATRGDTDARRILEHSAFAVAQGLALVVTLMAPSRIILGGGVSLLGDELWYEPIRRHLNRWVFPPLCGCFDLVSPELGEEVVVHGAIALGSRTTE
jgi:glucokinase